MALHNNFFNYIDSQYVKGTGFPAGTVISQSVPAGTAFEYIFGYGITESPSIKLNVAPQIVGERTLVPIRAVAVAYGCTVDWNDETQTVIITN